VRSNDLGLSTAAIKTALGPRELAQPVRVQGCIIIVKIINGIMAYIVPNHSANTRYCGDGGTFHLSAVRHGSDLGCSGGNSWSVRFLIEIIKTRSHLRAEEGLWPYLEAYAVRNRLACRDFHSSMRDPSRTGVRNDRLLGGVVRRQPARSIPLAAPYPLLFPGSA
jgi:hypothetical protein